MAYEDLGKCVTLEAGSDLSASQYCFVSLASDGQFDATGDGAEADGVLQDDPSAAGRQGQVMVGIGVTKIKAGAAVSVGDNVASDSTGRGVTAVSGDKIMGVALEAAANANEIFTMLFKPGAASL